MIKTKKATGKFVSALSMILAVGMLSTTVFAGGVLSGLSEDNYTIEITNNGERIELVNKPFIENDEVYVPLRELFEKYGILSSLQSYLEWDNGKISIGASFDPTPATVTMCYYNIETGSNLLTVNPSDKISPNKQYSVQMENSPLNIDGITYVPIQYMLYMLHDFYFIDYEIYDQNGNTAKSIVKMNIDEAENLSKNKTAAMTQGDSFSFKQALEKYISGSNIYYINDSYSLEYVDENTLWVWNWDNGSGINLAHTLFDRSGWWGEPNYWSWPKRIYSPEIVSNMTFEDRGFFYNLPLNK